jgi:hypothetical protein
MPKPRIEIVFRKGIHVAAFLHFPLEVSGRSKRQIAIRPPMVAHYDERGTPSGLDIPLPLTVSLRAINEALSELGQPAIQESDLAPLK